MEYLFDECKVSGKNVYVKGWIHRKDYKLILKSGNEERLVKVRVPRYDICVKFAEKVADNDYGFKEEVTFSKKVRYVKVFLEVNGKRELIHNIDNRLIFKLSKKSIKVLVKVKRGIAFLWREHRFLVPPVMMKKYLKILFEKRQIELVYSPNIQSEYNFWLEKYHNTTHKQEEVKDITFISNEKNNIDNVVVIKNDKDYIKQLENVKTKYVCLVNGKIELNNMFGHEVNKEINKDWDIIYFDNDIKYKNTYKDPMLKPDWSRDTLLGVNYIGNCFIIKKEVLKKLNVNKFNLYEILLNVIGTDLKVKHISKILYHDGGEIANGKKEVEAYLKKNNIDAKVEKNNDKVTNTIKYTLKKQPLISIVIPTKDHADILEQCLKSVYEKTTYKNFEVVVIDNNSEEEETFELLKKYDKKSNFTYKRLECEFNYSYINNEAVKLTKGEYIVLLNNDVEIITPEWLDYMLGYAMQKHIGTVGVKLIFPDETIQHAGIIMGKGGLAGHAHYGKPRDYVSLQYELKIPYNYSACTAACLMFSKEKFYEVGGLEEKLKVAFNDVDFNLKFIDKGYNNIFLPIVELYHYESKSRGLDTTPEKQKRFMQEHKFITEKWPNFIKHDNFYNDNFSKSEDYILRVMK